MPEENAPERDHKKHPIYIFGLGLVVGVTAYFSLLTTNPCVFDSSLGMVCAEDKSPSDRQCYKFKFGHNQYDWSMDISVPMTRGCDAQYTNSNFRRGLAYCSSEFQGDVFTLRMEDFTTFVGNAPNAGEKTYVFTARPVKKGEPISGTYTSYGESKPFSAQPIPCDSAG